MNIMITGAGGGLGSSLTALALERGHVVYASGREEGKVRNALKKCLPVPERWESADRLHICRMDVTNPEEVAAVAAQLEEGGIVLDGLIQCAGIMTGREETIETVDLSEVTACFQVNTAGSMRVVQAMLPLIKKGRNPCIINISSEAGTIINAFPTNYPYSISKAALNMFTERLREHLKEWDILVYAVHPGWMRTNMGGVDAPADPMDIACGILDIVERKKKSYSKIAFIDATGRHMPL